MATRPAPQPTPQQQLSAAKIIKLVSLFQIFAVPWVLLYTFTLSGMCTISSVAPYVSCEDFMRYAVPLVMIITYAQGVYMLNMSEGLITKAQAAIGGSSSNHGPVTRK